MGPKVGAELREAGLKAIAIACVLILIYIGFRFSVRFAPGAVVALIHDVSITGSIWILLGLEFDLRVLAALLAIIGYSLNDTIIVYDRIRENMELRTKYDLKEVLNHSVNQTLSRTLLTSLTTLAAVLSLLLLGGEVIRPFAMAMTIGILVGTYSSIFIASPSLLWLETRFGAASSGPRGERARGSPRPPSLPKLPRPRPARPRRPVSPRRRLRLGAAADVLLDRLGRCRPLDLAHLDRAVQDGAFLDHQTGRANVAVHDPGRLDLDPLGGAHVPGDVTHHHGGLGVDVGLDLSFRADRELVVGKVDPALDVAVDDQILVAGEIALDGDGLPDVRHVFPSAGAGRRIFRASTGGFASACHR